MPAFLLKPFGVFPSHLEQDPELPMAWASLGHACRSLPLPPHQVPLSLHPKQSLQTPRAQYSGQPLLTGGPGELPVDPGGWEPWEAGCPTHGRPRGLRLVSGNVCRCGCEGGRGKEAKLVLSARSRVRLFRRRQTPPIPSHSPQGGPSHSRRVASAREAACVSGEAEAGELATGCLSLGETRRSVWLPSPLLAAAGQLSPRPHRWTAARGNEDTRVNIAEHIEARLDGKKAARRDPGLTAGKIMDCINPVPGRPLGEDSGQEPARCRNQCDTWHTAPVNPAWKSPA